MVEEDDAREKFEQLLWESIAEGEKLLLTREEMGNVMDGVAIRVRQ